MSKLTQGTQVYFIDDTGSDPVVTEVDCPTAFNAGGAPKDQIEDTCLPNKARTYKEGLKTPGQAQLTINPDGTQYQSHKDMFDIYNMSGNQTLKWAVGWSDGTSDPSVDSNGDWDLPTDRTFITFEAYIVDFPFDFQLNSVVSGTIPLQRTGDLTWDLKA